MHIELKNRFSNVFINNMIYESFTSLREEYFNLIDKFDIDCDSRIVFEIVVIPYYNKLKVEEDSINLKIIIDFLTNLLLKDDMYINNVLMESILININYDYEDLSLIIPIPDVIIKSIIELRENNFNIKVMNKINPDAVLDCNKNELVLFDSNNISKYKIRINSRFSLIMSSDKNVDNNKLHVKRDLKQAFKKFISNDVENHYLIKYKKRIYSLKMRVS